MTEPVQYPYVHVDVADDELELLSSKAHRCVSTSDASATGQN